MFILKEFKFWKNLKIEILKFIFNLEFMTAHNYIITINLAEVSGNTYTYTTEGTNSTIALTTPVDGYISFTCPTANLKIDGVSASGTPTITHESLLRITQTSNIFTNKPDSPELRITMPEQITADFNITINNRTVGTSITSYGTLSVAKAASLSVSGDGSLFISSGFTYSVTGTETITTPTFIGKQYYITATPYKIASIEAIQHNIFNLFKQIDSLTVPIEVAKNEIITKITGDPSVDAVTSTNKHILDKIKELSDVVNGNTGYDYSYTVNVAEGTTAIKVSNSGSDAATDFTNYTLFYHDGTTEHNILYDASGFYYMMDTERVPIELGVTDVLMTGETGPFKRLSSFGKIIPISIIPLKNAQDGKDMFSFNYGGLNIYCRDTE